MPELRILSAAEVRQALPMAEAIEGMKEAYEQLSVDKVTMPLRSQVSVPEEDGLSLIMPAYIPQSADLALKVVSVFPNNLQKKIPVINAAVLVLDASTGQPLALLEGASLTAIRTGAGSGAATDLLARPDAKIVAIFGSGVQARTQLQAVCTVRDIKEVRIFSPNLDNARQFAQEMASVGPIPDEIIVTNNSNETVVGADIVCAATASKLPVFNGEDLKPGSHVNAIGSFTPDMQEVDVTTIQRSLIVVDSREAALEEAGDLIQPIESGEFEASLIHAELGEIITGQQTGRTDDKQITYFKSVGIAVQDVVAGRIALNNAQSTGLGTVVEL
jgi:ornithine cyclodeaminase